MKKFDRYRLSQSILDNHVRISVTGTRFQMLRIGNNGVIVLHDDPELVIGVDQYD